MTPSTAPILVQEPDGQAEQLFLLYHGVGSTPQALVGIGERLAREFPRSMVVSIPGRHASDLGTGCQWFSVAGISEDNRAGRIAEAMPEFIASVRAWQQRSGVTAHATALVGFSQGAIMSLEASQLGAAQPGEALCSRIVALSGRFASDPEHAPTDITLHFIHGKLDDVIHYGHAVKAAERLIALGGDVTADIIPFLAHQVSDDVLDLVIERLKTYVPARTWREALRGAPD